MVRQDLALSQRPVTAWVPIYFNEIIYLYFTAVSATVAQMLDTDFASLTESAYRRIRSELIHCGLVPGERLHIGNLTSELGVSLGAVREALSRLTAEGFVEAEPQKGFRAAPLSARDLNDLTDARIEVEALCLRQSLKDGDIEWESELLAAAHRLKCTPPRSGKGRRRHEVAWTSAHAQFYEALASACPNRILLEIRRQLFARTTRYRWMSASLAPVDRDSIRDHEICDAALRRDIEGTISLVTRQILETSQALLKWFEPRHSHRSTAAKSKTGMKPRSAS